MNRSVLLVVSCVVAACGPAPLTWHQDVAPIITARCASCHTAGGGIAPMPLTTYQEVYALRTAVKAAIESKRMPPWLLEDGCSGPVRNSRALTEAERSTVLTWLDKGALEGDKARAAALPSVQPLGLEAPDLTLKVSPPYSPPANKSDHYQCLVVDPHFDADHFVGGFEVVPDVRAQLHHVLLFSIPRTEAAKLDDREAGPGWTCYAIPTPAGTKGLGVWVPGSSATKFPPGTGVKVGPDDVFVMQVHMNTDALGAPQPDATQLKIAYAQGQVRTQLTGYLVSASGFAIPPQTKDFQFTKSHQVPADVKLWAAMPHMHKLGTAQRFEIERADAGAEPATQCLTDVQRWDFNWQDMYFYEKPIQVNQGDKVKVSCTWSNPNASMVNEGENTTDEMCLVIIMASL